MSKITQAKKEEKLKGKQKKIAEANAKKDEGNDKQTSKQKTAISGIPNYGKCCTCKNFPAKIKGCAQPCKILKNYVARKAEHPECYKCKIEG